MPYLKIPAIWVIVVIVSGIGTPVFSQTRLEGQILDASDKRPVPYVNIGIKGKNVGTISKEDGSFNLEVPPEQQSASVTFSSVGYYESTFPVAELMSGKAIVIELTVKPTQLNEVVITAEKPVEKKYGIRRRGAVHFTDGIFKKDDSFEIGQVINLGNSAARLKTVKLHINSSRPDSANFRINFYRFDLQENMPGGRLVEENIIQRHAVKEGWLTFDLSDQNILLKGQVLVSVEFIPEPDKDVKQIHYEVKIGGSSKSFFRKTSLGQWTRPPHHYCLYVTAVTDRHAPDDVDDIETPATVTLKSDFSAEPFSLFVKLPKGYSRNTTQTYPVIYLLDGNAYIDAVAGSAENLVRKKKISREPILVGIGYENAYIMDSLRSRDYTYPEAAPEDSFGVSGKGDKFYAFITSRIVKHIDSVYRTDQANRTLMGHSFGGYFVLYALMRQQTESSVFNNFVAASPSLFYHDNYLLKELNQASAFKDPENIKVYLTIGELEVPEDREHTFDAFSRILSEHEIDVQTAVYKNLEHMGTAIPTFENGILLLMRK